MTTDQTTKLQSANVAQEARRRMDVARKDRRSSLRWAMVCLLIAVCYGGITVILARHNLTGAATAIVTVAASFVMFGSVFAVSAIKDHQRLRHWDRVRDDAIEDAWDAGREL